MLLVVDTETGGLDARTRPILTIGYLIVTDNLRTVVESRELKIKARASECTRRALEINKIDLKKHNEQAITRRAAVTTMMADADRYFEGKFRLVGHNVAFDKKFLEAMFRREGKRFMASGRHIDTALMSTALMWIGRLDVENVRLDTMVDRFRFKTKGQRHSALVDATNTLKVLRKFRESIEVAY